MKLYKFRDVNEYSLDGLRNSKLWFSDLDDFNDPFEGRYVLDDKLTYTTMRQLMKRTTIKSDSEVGAVERARMLEEIGVANDGANKQDLLYTMALRDFKEALIKTVHNSKAVCLSHSAPAPENDPLYENLMWSHYANGLRGFCIVLDRQVLMDYFLQQELSIRPIEVQYQDVPMTLSLNDYVRSRHVLHGTDGDLIKAVTATIGCKSKAWAYENEFRFLSLENENLQSYTPEALSQVVIGEKMPDKDRQSIIDAALIANPTVVFKLARLKKDTYQLEITDYPSA
ncbi:DUF2971 domain-containing protein [Vibrio splendidus]|uniref:DUF2971 domain-containing protein n=1 Tax=Vibrio splendidus TaxID=29497 RepID=UPI000D350E40|nr:DUF2971 domain-containing protein [Vibrio splendidus]PTP81144.1 hypothetical protein CWO00_01475 [Vibrio splendidus]